MGRFSTKFHFAWNPNFPMNFGFLRFSISKSLIFMDFYGPSILCCLYTQFGVFKIFLEHMEGYALVMHYAWKMDFLKKILSFLEIFISKPSYFWSLDALFLLCCLYTQYNIIKKFKECMQSDALMLHIVWKMGFFNQFTCFWYFPFQNF